jgi:pimeloyl-ACP methyl ester carboxylesterase
VLHGEADPIPIEAAQTTARLIGADFHSLSHCGHVPYVEALEEFSRLLNAFLPRAASRQAVGR